MERPKLDPLIRARIISRLPTYTFGGFDDTPADRTVQARTKGKKLAATRNPKQPIEPKRSPSYDRVATDCVISIAVSTKWRACRGERDWTDMACELMFEASIVQDKEARNAYRFLAHIARYHASRCRAARPSHRGRRHPR